MPTAYVIAALTIFVLTCLSVIAGYWVGNVDRLPMQWGLNGEPTSYAPKWIALGLIPVISLIVMPAIAFSNGPGGDRSAAVRNMATTGAIMIACYLFYLYLLRRHVSG